METEFKGLKKNHSHGSRKLIMNIREVLIKPRQILSKICIDKRTISHWYSINDNSFQKDQSAVHNKVHIHPIHNPLDKTYTVKIKRLASQNELWLFISSHLVKVFYQLKVHIHLFVDNSLNINKNKLRQKLKSTINIRLKGIILQQNLRLKIYKTCLGYGYHINS